MPAVTRPVLVTEIVSSPSASVVLDRARTLKTVLAVVVLAWLAACGGDQPADDVDPVAAMEDDWTVAHQTRTSRRCAQTWDRSASAYFGRTRRTVCRRRPSRTA